MQYSNTSYNPQYSNTSYNPQYSTQYAPSASAPGIPEVPSVGKNKWKNIFFIILFIAQILMSLVDIGIDVADAAVDAVTVGVAGVATSVVDLISEIVLETIQIIITIITISMEGGGSHRFSNKTRIGVVVLCAAIDIVLTIIGFLPYFDLVETPVEVVTEIVQLYMIGS